VRLLLYFSSSPLVSLPAQLEEGVHSNLNPFGKVIACSANLNVVKFSNLISSLPSCNIENGSGKFLNPNIEWEILLNQAKIISRVSSNICINTLFQMTVKRRT
jgi:hypothetical protein